MNQWAEVEFERVSRGTRLSDRTLVACREVLVDGKSQGLVAREHNMFPAQISRSLATLRDKQEEMKVEAKAFIKTQLTLKVAAEVLARKIMGEGAQLFAPEAGQEFEGQIVAVDHGYAIQKIGRCAALHDVGRLPESPKVGDNILVNYPRDGARPTMEDRSTGKVLALRRATDVGVSR